MQACSSREGQEAGSLLHNEFEGNLNHTRACVITSSLLGLSFVQRIHIFLNRVYFVVVQSFVERLLKSKHRVPNLFSDGI